MLCSAEKGRTVLPQNMRFGSLNGSKPNKNKAPACRKRRRKRPEKANPLSMKKPNQVRRNSKTSPVSRQQKQSRRKRTIRVRVSAPFRRAIEQGAKRENITVSQFVEGAIRFARMIDEPFVGGVLRKIAWSQQ